MTFLGVAPSIAQVAAVTSNPARANVLVALPGGRALTAGELACAAWVSPQTTSDDLAKMTTVDARSVCAPVARNVVPRTVT